MTSPSKIKGSAWERIVRDYLRGWFPECERAYGAGRQDDRGDLAGIPGVVVECKAHRAMDLAGWVDEAEAERVNAGARVGVVVAKRRGKPVQDAYVVMPLSQFVELVK